MPARQKTIVVARRFGRMANRLTAFANLIAFAEDRGCRIVNPTLHSYSDRFEHLAHNFYCAYPPPARRSLFDRIPVAGNTMRSVRGLHNLVKVTAAMAQRFAIPGVVVVDTLRADEWPASPRQAEPPSILQRASIVLTRDWGFRVPDLVLRHAGAIRSFLRPVHSVETNSVGAVQTLREKAELIIGVHIRHGDYETFKGGRYFFPTEKYRSWMQELVEMHAPRSVAFLVCSDGGLELDAFADLVVGFGPGDPFGDIYALSTCDLLLGPVSTFTQWASFYGDTPLYHLRGSDDRPAMDRFVVSDLSEIP